MEDSNIWYYLVLGLIYFLSKAFGKKKAKRGSVPQTGEHETTHEQPAQEFSFEEILKELTGGKPASKTPPPPPLSTAPPVAYAGTTAPDDLPAYSSDEMDSIASTPFQSTYSKGLQYSQRGVRRKKDTFERAKKYALEEVEAVNYFDVLNEENGPARAFVMHEIFSKKY